MGAKDDSTTSANNGRLYTYEYDGSNWFRRTPYIHIGVSSSTNDDTDVVSLFTGFLSSTDNIPSSFQNERINSLLQTATHYIIGLEYDILNNLNINIEGYFKKFNQLIGQMAARLDRNLI